MSALSWTILHLVTLVILVGSVAISSIRAAKNSHRQSLITLNEDSWSQILKGEWMVDFYAPWCPACKSLKPEWQQLAEWSDDLSIKVGWADVTENPGLSGRFMVSGLPTIYHVKDGVFRLYSGPRDHKAIINFIEQQGWKAVQPVSRWLAPDTLQMSIVAHSFRISMSLRDVHKYLVEDVGLPYYVSYLIFALCTVTVGTLLGLVIVFIIDQFCPSQCASAAHLQANARGAAGTKSNPKKTDKPNESDLDDTEAKDSSKLKGSEKLTRRKVNN